MGLTPFSQNYKLVHVYTEPTQNCIPSTPVDYFINDNHILYLLMLLLLQIIGYYLKENYLM